MTRATARSGRLPDGALSTLLLAHLAAHPHTDFSPYELGRALRRSHGAIRRHLLRLAREGQVIRTRQQPARFRITT